jgi:hypothetical protein
MFNIIKKMQTARHRWFTSVIIAIQEAEIRRITIQSQLGQNSSQDPISKKNPSQKK